MSTELEARTRELEDANSAIKARDLRAVGEQARQIIRTLAHEVRNPLAAGANLIGDVVEYGKLDKAAGVVVLTVADSGTGIAPADRARIFDEFEQVDGLQDGRPSGSGFGLAFVRRAVERMGGTVALDSEPGRGTTVVVALPAQ